MTENEPSFLFVILNNSSFVSMMCFHMLPPFHLSYLASLGRRAREGIFQHWDSQTWNLIKMHISESHPQSFCF